MPSRPLLFDLRAQNGTICRSCLSAFRKQNTNAPTVAPFSAQACRRTPNRRRAIQSSSGQARPLGQRLPQPRQQGATLLQENEEGSVQDFGVRYFEQDGTKRRELVDEDAFSKSMTDMEGMGFQDGLLQMKANLQTQDEKDTFDSVVKQMSGMWKGVQSPEDLDRMMEDMDAYTRDLDSELKDATSDMPKHVAEELESALEGLNLELQREEDDDFTGSQGRDKTPQISERGWNLNQRKKIAKFNGIVSKVYKETKRDINISKKSVSAVYRAYHGTRLTLARAWSNVPMEMWDFLWAMFSADESVNAHRLAHISLLARDMSEAKVTLSPEQQLLTIEAVFVDGWETKAVENWRRCKPSLGNESAESFQEYWSLGVRMFCRTGDLDQAERAANKLLDKHQDARILMPLIRTWCEQHTTESQQKAWNAYRRMRKLLGKEMRITDYDQVIAYFLATGHTESALFVFVDMMSDGQIDLTKQKYMPTVIANKFFLGKWLKRLIGAGDLDGAYKVVEFMRSKGVEASSIQLNGLIGAWQRSGGANDLAMADKVAWQMIRERIRFVRARNNEGESDSSSESKQTAPRATIETFGLLAENYRLRELHGRQEELWDAFHTAQISPDAFMMNQLLESYIQVGQPKEALALYKSLVTGRGITPDPYTFSALWKTLGVNRLHVISPSDRIDEISATRALFKETLAYRSVFLPEGIDGQLARKILHSFRRLQDDSGFVVALAALKESLKFVAPEMLVVEMVIGTQRLSWDTASQRKRLLIAKREIDNGLVAWAQGDLSRLEDEKKGEALYGFLQKKFWPKDGGGVSAAANEMGVVDIIKQKNL